MHAAQPDHDQPLALADFDYDLPEGAVAQCPAEPRHSSKLLLLGADGSSRHSTFRQLPDALQSGDLLVVNTTQVIPARLQVRRASGARIELLLTRPQQGLLPEARRWRGLGRNINAVRPGERLLTAAGHCLSLIGREGAEVIVEADGPLWPILEAEGDVPLPPYISRGRQARASDAADYQSMFAQQPGAVAAPTASLHFTPELVAALQERGVHFAQVCLHVGPGTFLPVRPEHAGDVRQHRMHREAYSIPPATAAAVREALAQQRRVIPVGTTSLRALETWAASGEATGDSELFITPGYRFRVAAALVTNFHLPRSTLLLLVSAMAGRARILAAYREALTMGYRFFSFGDGMLIDNAVAPLGLGHAQGS